MTDPTLHVVTVIANPIRWTSRIELARKAVTSWLSEPNVHVTLVEVAHGGRDHELADLASDRVMHVGLRATTMAWSKENCFNLGIARLPPSAKFIATSDADIIFRKIGWANETVHALHLYPVVQPWKTALDLGPHEELLQTHTSFASLFHGGNPVVPTGERCWKFNGGPYEYAHPGFVWAWTRDILDRMGGIFEFGGMGSGDHHMALSIVGEADKSIPGGVGEGYRNAVKTWEARAQTHINGKLGYVAGVIEHMFHGAKPKRNYVGRWGMFVKHEFDPHSDLKRNTYGVIEFAGNKPALEREFDNYLRSRDEDANTV